VSVRSRSQSPLWAPRESAVRFSGERRRSGVSERWPKACARDTELVPTRRMPSDAVAALWMDELEGLK